MAYLYIARGVEHVIGERINAFLEGIRENRLRRRVYRQTLNELSALSDRDLADLGMQRNSIASELTAVIAQRLARRICTTCRTAITPTPSTLAELFPDGAPAGFRCYVGRGCDRCGGSGTRGRIALVEFLEVGPELRRAIARGMLVDDLRQQARQQGMATLRDNALELVDQGVISLEELYDVLSGDQMRGV